MTTFGVSALTQATTGQVESDRKSGEEMGGGKSGEVLSENM